MMNRSPLCPCGASPRGRSSHAGRAVADRSAGRISARAEQPRPRSGFARAGWAHLRAGGAAAPRAVPRAAPWGASPRGRSSPRRPQRGLRRGGRISARAEQPTWTATRRRRRRAHLRAGGAAPGNTARVRSWRGASPRGRSSPPLPLSCPRYAGRISARAEQPGSWASRRPMRTAHLRAGGAAAVAAGVLGFLGGASPRGRSSRRVRGEQGARGGRISARAEQPSPADRPVLSRAAHLRAGGAASTCTSTRRTAGGASPRGRSSLARLATAPPVHGRISARAEQPSPSTPPPASWTAHLRAGGAAISSGVYTPLRSGASPRGRSSPGRRRRGSAVRRRISARAEQPARDGIHPTRAGAHLRAGGAADTGRTYVVRGAGASPRGRSSRAHQERAVASHGRISARAEQPRPRRSVASRGRAHLRAGGAAQALTGRVGARRGASPRGRSSQRVVSDAKARQRRISARAEQPGATAPRNAEARAHLRAGGAAVRISVGVGNAWGASPRGRSSPMPARV